MKSLAERRRICDRLALHYYPASARREHRLREAILEHLPAGGAFLDAGSGPWLGTVRHVIGRARVAVGLDRVAFHPRGMRPDGGWAVRADLRAIPFRDEAVDVIALRSVLEHLEDPPGVFRELRRVLRPGGRILALAPSRWYFAAVIGRLVPDGIARPLLEGIFGQTVHDNYPVYYRANTPRAVRSAARAAGLELIEARVCPNPPGYLKFSPTLFRLGVFYDRLAGWTPFTRGLQASYLYLLGRP